MALSQLYRIRPSRLMGVPDPASLYFDAALLRELGGLSTAGKVSGRRDRMWPRGVRRRV